MSQNSLRGGIVDGTAGTLPYTSVQPILPAQGNVFLEQSGGPPVDPRSPPILGTCQRGAALTYTPARRSGIRSRSWSGPPTLTGAPATLHTNIHSILSEAVTNLSPRPYDTRDAGQSGATLSFVSDKTLNESSNPVRRWYVDISTPARVSAHYRSVGPLLV
jgi:hypothetical protein